MEVKQSYFSKKLLLAGAISIVYFVLAIQPAFATNAATISFSPSTGTYSKQFTVSAVVDGGGQTFNAAQVAVSLSSNLSIQNLILGNCNFSFLTTPTITNPSFAGVILGGSSPKCTVYTLTLAPIQKGSGAVTLSKGSVKRYGDAVNILSNMRSGTYILTDVVKVAPQPTIIVPKGGLYTLVLIVNDINGALIKNTQVNIHSVSNKTPLQGKTDTAGKVQFQNIQEGVYATTVQGYAGDTVLNVTGKNHVLVLGIKLQKQQSIFLSNPFVIGGLLVSGIIFGSILMWVFLRKKYKMK